MDDVERALLLLACDLTPARLHEHLARPPVVWPQSTEFRGAALRARLESVGGRVVGLRGDLPDRLGELADANPAPLFTTDAPAEAFAGPAVAVVGTRRATSAGLEIAENLGAYLAQAGVVVVSGLARGIDAAAHRGVVAEQGVGLAVLGSGLDVIYPRGHVRLADELRASGGGLVSQYAPGVTPHGWRFPRRNSVIAALADAVVVVESHATGGALTTVNLAAELGRSVMAVPGSPLVPAAAGCNHLLRDGAYVVAEFADIVEVIGLDRLASPPLWSEPPDGDPLSRRVLDALTADPVTIDALVRIVRADAPAVSRAVSRLEVAGVIARERGGVRRRARK